MDLSPHQFDEAQFPAAARKDGWTPELKARFLARLAEAGNVRLSARCCERSPQSAYIQRRRDPLFARGWDAAMVLARSHAEQVLADRAIDGVEEHVYYRGELVGTRRRFDTRLLLAHLARLDKQCQAPRSARDAGRFDEIVALVAGEDLPEPLADTLTPADRDLPSPRLAYAEQAARQAEATADAELPKGNCEEIYEELEEEEYEVAVAAQAERRTAIIEAGDAAYMEAQTLWDGWFGGVCDRVDDIIGEPLETLLLNRVNGSTSTALVAPPYGEEAAIAAPRVASS